MILVTGATGFLATHLIANILEKNKTTKIRALYRCEKKKAYSLKFIKEHYNISDKQLKEYLEWFIGDILDIHLLDIAFQGIKQVYHCAALVSFDPKDHERLRKVNIEGSCNIVNLCLAQKENIKLCHVSSIAALGSKNKNNKISETSSWNPQEQHSVYAISKYGSELEVWRGIQEGLSAVIVNPGIILGEGFKHSPSGRLIKKCSSGIPFYTTGTTGYIYVKDAVNIMIQLQNSNINNENFILTENNYNYKEVFSTLSRDFNKPEPKFSLKNWQIMAIWILGQLGQKLLGIKPIIYRSSIRSSFDISLYQNKKLKEAFPELKLSSLQEMSKYISQTYKNPCS